MNAVRSRAIAWNPALPSDSATQPHDRRRRLRIRVHATVEADGPPTYIAGDPHAVFAAWNFDGEVLRVRNCRFGFQPMFYRRYADGISVAPSITDLIDAGDAPILDLDALAAFLQIGFYLAEDTPYRDIRALPPDATLTWRRDEGVRLACSQLPSPRPVACDRPAAAAEYARLFERAVAACIERIGSTERLYVPLSGGADSRHIALALNELARPPRAFVNVDPFPGGSVDDTRLARDVAQRLGVELVRIRQPLNLAPNFMHALEATGYLCDEHAWYVPLARWLRAHADAVFDGIGGDVMSAGLYSAPTYAVGVHLRRGELFDAARALMRMWGGGEVLRLAPDAVRECIGPERALARIAAEMERFARHANPARDFFFWNRTRREIAMAPFALYAPCRVATPFLDANLWEFLAGLPFDLTADRRFHAEAIGRAYPRFANVAFADHGSDRAPWDYSSRIITLGGFAWQFFARSPTLRAAAFAQLARALVFVHRRLVRGAYFAAARAIVAACLLSSVAASRGVIVPPKTARPDTPT